MYLYCASDSVGDTVESFFSKRLDLPAPERLLGKALQRRGRPDRTVIDGSQANHETIISSGANRLRDRTRRSIKPIRIRKSKYLDNRMQQDHRRSKRRIRPMLGFKSMASPRSFSPAPKWPK